MIMDDTDCMDAASYKFLQTLADICLQIAEEEEQTTLQLVADNGSCASIFKQRGY